MAQAYDTFLVTAPQNLQVSADRILVTPTGGEQQSLGDALAASGGASFVGPAGTVNASDGSGGGQTTSITDDGSGASIQFAGGDAQMTSNGGASRVSVTAAGDVELLSTNALINLTGAGAINMASSGGAAALDGDGILTVGSPAAGVAVAGWVNAELGVAVNGVALTGGGLPAGGSVGQPVVNTGSGTGDWGNEIRASTGNDLLLFAGSGGGYTFIRSGDDTGTGAGVVALLAGPSTTTGIPGGGITIGAGGAQEGDADGGPLTIYPGLGVGTGRAGQIKLNNTTDAPGASVGTLTNAPSVGNPDRWIEIVLDGTVGAIPWWTT